MMPFDLQTPCQKKDEFGFGSENDWDKEWYFALHPADNGEVKKGIGIILPYFLFFIWFYSWLLSNYIILFCWAVSESHIR